MCGPLCSSAARARYGRPVVAAPRAQSRSRPVSTCGAKTWFSRYPCAKPDTLHQLGDALRFGDVSRQRLLARDALERSLAALDRVDDLFDVLDARLIRSGQPDRVDRRIGDHVGDRRVRLRVADVERARQLGRRRRVLLVRAPDAEHVGIAHGAKRLHVKARIEAAADERDAESR